MELKRYLDWPVRLNEYIIASEKKKFEHGTHDCVIFAAGAIEAMTGENPMLEFRDQYDDWNDSEEGLNEAGYDKLYKNIIKRFGTPILGVKGQKGDLAFYEGACGIVLGRYAMFLGENGYVYVSLRHLQRAFRVA